MYELEVNLLVFQPSNSHYYVSVCNLGGACACSNTTPNPPSPNSKSTTEFIIKTLKSWHYQKRTKDV